MPLCFNKIQLMQYLFIIALLAGWGLDLLFGDPARLPHPVVWMGRWIAFGERRLNKANEAYDVRRERWLGRISNKARGAIFAMCSIAGAYIITKFLFGFTVMWAYKLSEYLGASTPVLFASIVAIAFSVIVVFYCFAGCTLRREVRMVFEAVDRSIEDGRRQVARIVGRDTSTLSAQECRTAALETLAENLSDGVIAPLFWYSMLGLPGMIAYKMVNTLDSMIGYQNHRYKDFGCWAARIDDIANFIPARLTAILMIMATKPDGKNPFSFYARMFGFVASFGPRHASPNSGWPEAALAGALNCRFGGPHHYFGEYFYKPFIGTNDRQLTTADMKRSIRICFIAECLAVGIIVLYSL